MAVSSSVVRQASKLDRRIDLDGSFGLLQDSQSPKQISQEGKCRGKKLSLALRLSPT